MLLIKPQNTQPSAALTRRGFMVVSGAAAMAAMTSLSGCAAAPTVAVAGPEAGAAVGAIGDTAASALTFMARAVGMDFVTDHTTDVLNQLAEAVKAFLMQKDVESSPSPSPTDSTVTIKFDTNALYHSAPAGSSVYATTVAVQRGVEATDPVPVLFAANNAYVNLLPRAVQALGLVKPSLVSDCGVRPEDVALFTLPLTGWLTGPSYADVSYETVAGRVEFTYLADSANEIVTITGLPGVGTKSWSFPTKGLYLASGQSA